ncbi:MAG TPA: type II toxin-antitoxin system RelE/ParE family toxin [Verrucomicrobiae bacterium]
MGQATEIYSAEFDKGLERLPPQVRTRILQRIRDLGRRLESHTHERLQGREEFKLRVGDYRVIYEFDISSNEVYLITLGHRREIYR